MNIFVILCCLISLTITKNDSIIDNLSIESKLILSKLRGLQTEVSNIFESVTDENQKEMIEEILNSEEQAFELKAGTLIYSNNMDSLTEGSRQILARLREVFVEQQTLIDKIEEEDERQKVIAMNLQDELENLQN